MGHSTAPPFFSTCVLAKFFGNFGHSWIPPQQMMHAPIFWWKPLAQTRMSLRIFDLRLLSQMYKTATWSSVNTFSCSMEDGWMAAFPPSFFQTVVMLLCMAQVGGKSRHSPACLMRACDTPLFVLRGDGGRVFQLKEVLAKGWNPTDWKLFLMLTVLKFLAAFRLQIRRIVTNYN